MGNGKVAPAPLISTFPAKAAPPSATARPAANKVFFMERALSPAQVTAV